MKRFNRLFSFLFERLIVYLSENNKLKMCYMNIFKDWGKQETYTYTVALSNLDDNLTTGIKEAIDSFPFKCEIVDIYASVNTAPTGSNDITIDVQINSSSIFTNKIHIDLTKTKSKQSAVQPSWSKGLQINEGDVVTFIIDKVGGTVTGKGVKVYIKYIKL